MRISYIHIKLTLSCVANLNRGKKKYVLILNVVWLLSLKKNHDEELD